MPFVNLDVNITMTLLSLSSSDSDTGLEPPVDEPEEADFFFQETQEVQSGVSVRRSIGLTAAVHHKAAKSEFRNAVVSEIV